MNEYKISKVVDNRVMNYRFSVSSKKDPQYIKLKATVKEHNRVQRNRESAGLEPHYIRVRGRGRSPIKSGPQNKWSIIDSNAEYFDVYVQRDTDAMERYRTRTATSKIKGFMAKSVAQINSINDLMKPMRQSA